MKTIYDTGEAYLREGDGVVLIGLRAWGHTASIQTEIWMQLVRAWIESREGPVPPSGELWVISKDRLAMFLAEAEALSFHGIPHPAPASRSRISKHVKLRKVKELLFNLASGRRPDEPRPPSWAGKDVVGYLLRRDWKITDDGEGMQRRGYFIPAEKLQEVANGSGAESTADVLECEGSQRTDREDTR